MSNSNYFPDMIQTNVDILQIFEAWLKYIYNCNRHGSDVSIDVAGTPDISQIIQDMFQGSGYRQIRIWSRALK